MLFFGNTYKICIEYNNISDSFIFIFMISNVQL